MRVILFCIILIFFNCYNNTNQTTVKSETPIIFDLQKGFKITSNQKIIDKNIFDEVQLTCGNWNLEKQDLKKIMQSMKSIRGEEWHHLFGHLACEINGELIQNQNVFKYSINAGSWMSVYTKDTTLWFGDINKINEALFMSTVLDMKNE